MIQSQSFFLWFLSNHYPRWASVQVYADTVQRWQRAVLLDLWRASSSEGEGRSLRVSEGEGRSQRSVSVGRSKNIFHFIITKLPPRFRCVFENAGNEILAFSFSDCFPKTFLQEMDSKMLPNIFSLPIFIFNENKNGKCCYRTAPKCPCWAWGDPWIFRTSSRWVWDENVHVERE